MEIQSHSPILKRVGAVLLAIGLLDATVMFFCILNRLPYRPTLAFGLPFSIFLIRGSLRAAAIVRWLCIFMLSASVLAIFVWPAIQPVGLTLMKIQFEPAIVAGNAAFLAIALLLSTWILHELRRVPTLGGSNEAGLKSRGMYLPMSIGATLVTGVAVSSNLFHKCEWAERAKSMAEQEVGSGYKLHVDTLRISSIDQGTSVYAVVSAWNDREIREISVRWEEARQ
jgi:hypothetical protein